MNKDFEMAKYLATIGSIFLVATTLFFQQSNYFEGRFYEMKKDNLTQSQDIINNVARTSLNFLESGDLYMILGGILLTLSLIFAGKGYLDEIWAEKHPTRSTLSKELE